MKGTLALLVVVAGVSLAHAAARKHHARRTMTMGNTDTNILEVADSNVLDCHSDFLGTDYRGRRSTTMSGYTCQRWDAQSPHEHTRNDVSELPDAINNKLNFCRNPDQTAGVGPWCYTTNPDIRWESCGIPICPDCKPDQLGTYYGGMRSTTASGRTCQRWDSQYPHHHTRNDPSEFDYAVLNEDNFCRNPDSEPLGPWCYTTDTDVRWEYCGIPVCTECKNEDRGTSYRGHKITTISGLTCQRWDSQNPHEHSRNDVSEYPDAIHNEDNYCRNPDHSDGIGPWCYTTDPLVRWEPCGIPFCPGHGVGVEN